MKKVIKQIIKGTFYFISRFFNSIKFLIYVIFKTDLRNHIQKVDGAGVMTILANGPSLKDDLDKIDLTKGDFCVVNDFYKSPWYSKIKPKYHVLADPLYFVTDEDIQPFVDAVKWEMTLFVPYYGWKKMSILNKIPSEFITVVPYHSVNYHGFECLRSWFYEKGLSMPRTQNVLVPSIFNTIKMGYKEILIYGADHSWTESIRVNNDNQVCLTDSHFYDTEQVKLLPWRKASPDRAVYKMHEILRDLAQMFDSYHQIRWYADKVGCKIINRTKRSYIDAFERA